MITCGPMDLRKGYDIILDIVVESKTNPLNQLIMWRLPPHRNTYSNHLSFDVRFFNNNMRNVWSRKTLLLSLSTLILSKKKKKV